MPDGQGQVSNLDLGALERIEVLRGPSRRCTATPPAACCRRSPRAARTRPGQRASAAFGADATRRVSANLRGLAHGTDYNVQASALRTDGYREHGRAERDLVQRDAALAGGRDGELALLANGLSSPLAQDRWASTDAQWRADPRQASPAALQFDTRKSLQHRMLGMDLRVGDGAQEWRLLGLRRHARRAAVPGRAGRAGPIH
jgi:iron complex outermembrane receptor protein